MIKAFNSRKFEKTKNLSKPMSGVRDEVQDGANTAETEHSRILNTNLLHYLEDKVMAKIWIFSSLLGIWFELKDMGSW